MRVTKAKLKQLIKEESANVLNEQMTPEQIERILAHGPNVHPLYWDAYLQSGAPLPSKAPPPRVPHAIPQHRGPSTTSPGTLSHILQQGLGRGLSSAGTQFDPDVITPDPTLKYEIENIKQEQAIADLAGAESYYDLIAPDHDPTAIETDPSGIFAPEPGLYLESFYLNNINQIIKEEIGKFEGLEGGPLSGYINDVMLDQTRRMTPEELDRHVGLGVRWEDNQLIQKHMSDPPQEPALIDQQSMPGMTQGIPTSGKDVHRSTKLQIADPLNLRHARHGMGRAFQGAGFSQQVRDDITLDLLHAEQTKGEMTPQQKMELAKFLVDMGQIAINPIMTAAEVVADEQYQEWIKNNPDQLRDWLDSRKK